MNTIARRYPHKLYIVFMDLSEFNSTGDDAPAMIDPTSDWDQAVDEWAEWFDRKKDERDAWVVEWNPVDGTTRDVTREAARDLAERCAARDLEVPERVSALRDRREAGV